jgi:hypothetical protein
MTDCAVSPSIFGQVHPDGSIPVRSRRSSDLPLQSMLYPMELLRDWGVDAFNRTIDGPSMSTVACTATARQNRLRFSLAHELSHNPSFTRRSSRRPRSTDVQAGEFRRVDPPSIWMDRVRPTRWWSAARSVTSALRSSSRDRSGTREHGFASESHESPDTRRSPTLADLFGVSFDGDRQAGG